MNYEIIMGLEVHVELSTKSKIFCGCTTEFGGEPNSHVCPICLGLPGTLPVLNKEVVNKAIKAGLALNGNIQMDNRFDRKNYFYPDLPKDYQISQLYRPILRNGHLDIEVKGKTKRITLCEMHMEEDAGKLVHHATGSLVDYNRCGVPLIEIVTNPDFREPEEVVAFLAKLQQILQYLDVSDCKMQEGSMRADVNLSVRPVGSTTLGTRTEMKNLNSFKAIVRAIEFESKRQIDMLNRGEIIVQETRRWDDNMGESISMRSKENAQDYRYFPDPDLIPINLDKKWLHQIEDDMVELPEAKRERYEKEFKISKNIAEILTSSRSLAEFFEKVGKESGDYKLSGNFITGEILRLLKEEGKTIEESNLDYKKVAVLLKMVSDKKINKNSAKGVLEKIFYENIDPVDYVEKEGLLIIEDLSLVNEVIDKVIAVNENSISDYFNGKEKAFGFLVGQIMRETKGKATPATVNEILKEKLSKLPKHNILNDDKKTSLKEKEFKRYNVDKWDIKIEDCYGDVEYRNCSCAELTLESVGKEVTLAGFISTVRNHGGIVFLDLRDDEGITQIVITESMSERLNKESVISVTGEVLKREEDTINEKIKTGQVEVKAKSIRILSEANNNLPFEIENSLKTKEDVRLKYRFLDLRNPKVHNKIVLRAEVIKFLRNKMEDLGFMEIQTPILANSSPEGARDYLVPSRKHKGMFYALPQAPQQFKQMLMASGFDKYYQIAPCFRDEDARLDRSPGEFYQLDFEMAFVKQEQVFEVADEVLYETFKKFSNKEVSKPPFRKITFEESMLKYGSDKPDLRNPLVITDLTEFFEDVDFEHFKGKTVRGIKVKGKAKMPKSFFEKMESYAKSIGMKGLGYITVNGDMSLKGPIDKFFTEEKRSELLKLEELEPEDILYFISDEEKMANKYAGNIRTELGKRLKLIDEDRFEFCYIVDFPMFEINEETGKIDFTHNPFSMPQGEMKALETKNPLDIKAYQYDIVVNGVELSSGAIRNHRPDIMKKAFEIAGYTEDDLKDKFDALYTAFKYGVPPHGGMAPGVDRMIMLLSGDENIREIIPFPLSANGQNLLFNAPSEVSELQKREVHIEHI